MKKEILYFLSLSLLVLLSCNRQDQKNNDSTNLKGTISISGAFALYPMIETWKEEYNKLYPDVQIDVSAGGAGKGMADVISGMVSLGMVSREISQIEVDKGAWYIPVVKDAVVGVINKDNPVLADLLANGLTKETIKKIFITGEIKTWGEAIGDPAKSNVPIKIYTRSDACGAADIWSKFLGYKQEDLLGVGVYGDPGIAQAVQNDKNGIGYNNIGFVYNNKTKHISDGLKALPLDNNNNGKLDPNENFYDNSDSLNKAIIENIYPSPPARDLYLVSKGKPSNMLVLHFLNWILTDGQKFVPDAGYIILSKDKIKSSIDKIK